MSGRKKRLLSAEERALWNRVAERTSPLANRPSATATLLPGFSPNQAKKTKPAAIQPFEISAKARGKSPGITSPVLPDAAPVKMDRKAFQSMTKGRLRPEAKLDLHGMILADAQPALTQFLIAAQASGKRLVLIVTGKGKTGADDGPIPVRRGVLRHQIPIWLARVPLAQIVLQVSEAHARHGGGGAFYVYLRRNR